MTQDTGVLKSQNPGIRGKPLERSGGSLALQMRVQSPELGRELFRVPQSGGDPTSQPIEMLLYLLPLFENIQLPEYLYFIYFWCKHTFFLKKKKTVIEV